MVNSEQARLASLALQQTAGLPLVDRIMAFITGQQVGSSMMELDPPATLLVNAFGGQGNLSPGPSEAPEDDNWGPDSALFSPEVVLDMDRVSAGGGEGTAAGGG